YADRGITFNNPDAFDFSGSSILGYPPDFAHSGANAIKTCFAIEFCTGGCTKIPAKAAIGLGGECSHIIFIISLRSHQLPTGRVVVGASPGDVSPRRSTEHSFSKPPTRHGICISHTDIDARQPGPMHEDILG